MLELGIVAHSVIIGISLGSSQSPQTIKPLLAALSFHQFFEGMGLGGCISQVSDFFILLFYSHDLSKWSSWALLIENQLHLTILNP